MDYSDAGDTVSQSELFPRHRFPFPYLWGMNSTHYVPWWAWFSDKHTFEMP